jgi:predicted ribosomally synthesized peptide with nif11-like leader
VTTAAAQQFFERMKSDWDFYFRVALAEGPDQRMTLVRAEGFDCTSQEVAAACEQLREGLPEFEATN